MPLALIDSAGADRAPVPVTPLSKDRLAGWLEAQEERVRAWVRAVAFRAEPGAPLLLPAEDGTLARVLVGIEPRGPDAPADPWGFGGLPYGLPEGVYALESTGDAALDAAAALGWALGAYRFTRYRAAERAPARLVWPEGCDRAALTAAAEATALVRDLINTPANDLGPAELAVAAQQLAAEFEAQVSVIVGEDLLVNNYPTVHAVGRASRRPPRLIDLRWGDKAAPKVTVVGKGVCFDTGGLDIKPSAAMLLMKKDMGGAAQALGLARLIMAAALPVRLRVLIPAVDNAISGDAFRPLDVIRTRRGATVEIGNTDAEGRLILADALHEADDEQPALIVDFATLTGAARVALGVELPAMFCNDEPTAATLLAAAHRVADPLWRLPLWQPYVKLLRSGVADISNVGDGQFGGAITAALFLEQFLVRRSPWVHIDLYGWNQADRPGRPKGGEAMGMRAVFALLAQRFGSEARS